MDSVCKNLDFRSSSNLKKTINIFKILILHFETSLYNDTVLPITFSALGSNTIA